MSRSESYATDAPAAGAGVEVMSFCFLERDRARAQQIIASALAKNLRLPRAVRVERADRDLYIEWGSSSHSVKPFFVYLRKKS